MRDLRERPLCHRAEDLVTYLYGEAGDAEAIDFHNHLQHCDACKSEFAVFNQVHESILVWRNEALGTSFNPALPASESAVNSPQFLPRKLSALAALREFFSVSPLWLRGATALAGLLLSVLLAFAVSSFWDRPISVVKDAGESKFTQADMDKAVAEAKRQTATVQQTEPRQSEASPMKPEYVAPQSPRVQRASTARSVTPRVKGLTRQEQEQLAADLRLSPSMDDEGLPFVLSDQPDK